MTSRRLISVIDDDDSVRESLQALMRSVGFAVKTFVSAEEFLNWDRMHDSNCLILDVSLPGMSGIELHRHLVASRREIPVILITAHESDEEVRSQALQAGAVDYLIKPFSEEALLSAIRTALGSK